MAQLSDHLSTDEFLVHEKESVSPVFAIKPWGPVGLSRVFPGTFKQNKIFYSVVGLVLVNVMNTLRRIKDATYVFFHYQSVFCVIALLCCPWMVRGVDVPISAPNDNIGVVTSPHTFVTTENTGTLSVLWYEHFPANGAPPCLSCKGECFAGGETLHSTEPSCSISSSAKRYTAHLTISSKHDTGIISLSSLNVKG